MTTTRYQITCARCAQEQADQDNCPHLVTVGWDDRLQTYYGQVEDRGSNGSREDGLPLRLGGRPRELPSVYALRNALSAWAEIPEDVWTELERDGHTAAAEAPSGSGSYALTSQSYDLVEDDDDLRPRGSLATRPIGAIDQVLRERRSSMVETAGGIPGASAMAEYRQLLRNHLLVAVPRLIMVVVITSLAAAAVYQVLRLLALAILAAGAGLAWRAVRLPDHVVAWRRGARGERKTAKLLSPLERHGFTVFHDLALPGGKVNIDHLVIGPTGVWMIDSKSWHRRTVVDAEGRLWRGRKPADQTVRVAWWEAEQVADLFDGLGLDAGVNPVLVVHGTQLPAIEAIAEPGVRVVAPDYLAAVVSRPPVTLLPHGAAQLVDRTREVFGLRSRDSWR
jgi:hypothetical protein